MLSKQVYESYEYIFRHRRTTRLANNHGYLCFFDNSRGIGPRRDDSTYEKTRPSSATAYLSTQSGARRSRTSSSSSSGRF